MTLQMGTMWHLICGLVFLHLLIAPHPTDGLIGYDCTGATLNITTVSLLEVGECDIPEQEVNETDVHIQLLQINNYQSIHVRQCKVEIFRIIRRCGMWSHGMDVPNGEFSYIDSISPDSCLAMYRTGEVKIGVTEIHGIVQNGTTHRPVHIAGIVDQDGDCTGVYYSDPYGNWEKVFVKGTVKITLRDYWADVDVESNRVHLRSGTRCELNEGHCVDIDGGDTYWDPFPEDSCHIKRYGVLYEGPAKRTSDADTQYRQTMYSLTEGDVVFALTAKSHLPVCGYTLIRTEHPKLLIVEIQKGNPFLKKEALSVTNLDLFAYVNSKFVYVEKHIRTQMKQMYRDILTQRCNLERQVLENTIGLAKQAPDEFAYNIMKGPGYMAALAGEVAHIIKCIALEVKIRDTKECYIQLPVEVGNQSYHLTPRTHIMKKTGTQVTCNGLVPSMYKIGGEWYSIEPRPVHATPPTILKPLTKRTWTYRNPQALAVSGIYTQKDLDDLRDHIMFPAEQPAILNSVARGIAGQPTITQGGTIANLIDEQAINKIIQSSWEKSWGYFTTFGTFSAGMIGVIMLCRGIKLIVDTVIHGYALHTVYGWSLYLLGSVWDSVTHLLMHLAKKPPKTDKDDNNDEGSVNGKPPNNDEPPQYQPMYPRAGTSAVRQPELRFGFDPRIYDLQHTVAPDPPIHHYHAPANIHKDGSSVSTDPLNKPGYPTLPRSTAWKSMKLAKSSDEIYKTPRPIYYTELVERGLQDKEEVPKEECILLKNEDKPEPQTSKEPPATLYPPLDEVKKSVKCTPLPDRKPVYFTLERRTDNNE